jgi:hypothetical protein
LGKIQRICCRRLGELVITQGISHYTNTPLVDELRILVVLNEGGVVDMGKVAVGGRVVAEAGWWQGECISLLST